MFRQKVFKTNNVLPDILVSIVYNLIPALELALEVEEFLVLEPQAQLLQQQQLLRRFSVLGHLDTVGAQNNKASLDTVHNIIQIV